MELKLDQLESLLERLAKLPRHYRIAMLPLIVALVGGIYTIFFYTPAREQLDLIHTRQLELQRKLNEVRSVATNVEAFEEEIGALEAKLTIALRQLPDSKELPVLLTDISSLGKNAGLEFQAFRPRTEVVRDFYAEVPIEIEFSGEYHDIASFFDRVAKLPRIVAVRELRMKIEEENAFSTRLHVTGSAITFRFLEQVESGAEGGKTKKGAASRAGARGGAA